METPPLVSKKPNVSSLTKTSLTPCRRMGLSRRSSSLIKQIHQSVKSETTPVQSDSSEINVSSTTTPDAVVLTNTPTTTHPIVSVKEKKVTTILKVRRCLGTPVKENNSTSTEKQQENSSSLASLEVSKRKEDPHILKKRKLGHESCEDTYQETNVSKDSEKQNEMENATEPAADEVIRQVLMSIKEKKKMLDTLKVQETYAKKVKFILLTFQLIGFKN